MLVYKITNTVNNKSYIGQTIRSIEERWAEHCKPANKGRSYISSAIQKYGKSNFLIEILGNACTQTDLDSLEKTMIKKHNTLFPNGYNLKEGGSRGALTEEVKKKIGKASKGKHISPESIKKMKASTIASKHTRITFDDKKVKCSLCFKWKERKEFNKNKARSSGVQSQCKDCRSKNRPDIKRPQSIVGDARVL